MKEPGKKSKNESKTEIHIEQHTEMHSGDEQLEELENDLKRVQAEFVNYKRRVETERAEYLDMGRVQAVMTLLPLLDNISRALDHLPPELAGNAWAQGVAHIAKQADDTLKSLGVEKIPTVGTLFDPNLHEAIGGEGDMVSEELQAGYKLGERVIRHAIVKVGEK
jgi:molecular chaperone GrpE